MKKKNRLKLITLGLAGLFLLTIIPCSWALSTKENPKKVENAGKVKEEEVIEISEEKKEGEMMAGHSSVDKDDPDKNAKVLTYEGIKNVIKNLKVDGIKVDDVVFKVKKQRALAKNQKEDGKDVIYLSEEFIGDIKNKLDSNDENVKSEGNRILSVTVMNELLQRTFDGLDFGKNADHKGEDDAISNHQAVKELKSNVMLVNYFLSISINNGKEYLNAYTSYVNELANKEGISDEAKEHMLNAVKIINGLIKENKEKGNLEKLMKLETMNILNINQEFNRITTINDIISETKNIVKWV